MIYCTDLPLNRHSAAGTAAGPKAKAKGKGKAKAKGKQRRSKEQGGTDADMSLKTDWMDTHALCTGHLPLFTQPKVNNPADSAKPSSSRPSRCSKPTKPEVNTASSSRGLRVQTEDCEGCNTKHYLFNSIFDTDDDFDSYVI